MSWETLRRKVYKRDKGVCQICGMKITEEQYECGHIVDYALDGSNEMNNLLAMCIICNRFRKPMHSTKDEFYEWLELWKTKELMAFKKLFVKMWIEDEKFNNNFCMMCVYFWKVIDEYLETEDFANWKEFLYSKLSTDKDMQGYMNYITGSIDYGKFIYGIRNE